MFHNNNQKRSVGQQTNRALLKPVISTYWNRLDEDGLPAVKVTFVKSTVEPPYRYVSLHNWAKRISLELIFMRTLSGLKSIFNPFKKGGDDAIH